MELLDGQAYVRRMETTDQGALRLYVDDGTVAIPQILRAMDGARLELESIQLHRPSLDDVFLAKTGRLMRDA